MSEAQQTASPETVDPTISDALQTWRQSEPVTTQERIARVADVSLTTAHSWCHGRGCPDVYQIRRLEIEKGGLVALLFPVTFNRDQS